MGCPHLPTATLAPHAFAMQLAMSALAVNTTCGTTFLPRRWWMSSASVWD